MKNKLLLLLITIFASSSITFAASGAKVISDAASKSNTNKDNADFTDVNQFTDNFFTPHVTKTKILKNEQFAPEQRSKEVTQSHGSLAPIKKLRYKLQNRNKPKALAVEDGNADVKDQALLNCEIMQYFADRTELQAEGHVVMFFPQNNSTIKADKMVYNQTSNLIKAYGNVVLINDGKELHGDYMNIDMNEENALMDNPVTDLFQIRATAKQGYMYGDKIIQEQGSMYVTKKTMINVVSEMFGPNLDTMFVEDKDKSYFMKDSHGEKFKIKTNDLLINSKKNHDTVTLKHAEIYFNDKKVGLIPSITLHTNKAQDYLEANFPEIGTVTNLGFYAGPGFVFDTPKGTTLKLVPLLNYQGNADNADDNKLGFGAIAKFKSATNQTDFAYGTSNKVFIMRGKQKLDDNLYFQYASNSYMDDWFLGYRMPKLMGELVYQDMFLNPNFFGEKKGMTFTHRAAAGYMQSGPADGPLLDGQGGIGTMRFKYMAEVAQTLYSYNSSLTSPINGNLELVGQDSTALYGTGGTQFIARIGPRIHTQYKRWMQDVGYFLSAYNDNTPLVGYDNYMYGRSNVYMRESFRLCRYLTLSWFGSLNLSNDSWNGDLMQENGFYFSIGPDDVKLNIGYDSVRQQTFVTMALHLDAKGSTIEYKRMIIKNPDTLGKSKDEDAVKQTFAPSDSEGDGIMRAEVIDIPNEAL